MKALLALAAMLVLAGCASFEGRGLAPGVSTAAEVERVMGAPAERRQVGAETWLYYPRQPYGRKTFVARLAGDGRLVAVEQRLTDQTIAQIVPNVTRAEQVRDLLGPPYNAMQFPRMDRNTWTWHVRRFGDPGMPAALTVQMTPDGVVREVFYIDESSDERLPGLTLGFGFSG